MEFLDKLLLKTKSMEEEYFKVSELLLAPEITIDIVNTTELLKRKEYLENIVTIRHDILSLIEDIKSYNSYTSDDPMYDLAREMLEEDKVRLNELVLKLAANASQKKDNDKTLLFFTNDNSNQTNLQKLIDLYITFLQNNDLKVTKINAYSFLLEGQNTMAISSTLCGRHKLYYDKSSTSILVYSYTPVEVKVPTLNDSNVRVDIFLSHGKGGQNINKVETAVRLTYLPTGLQITCQDERSQLKNKERAFERLKTTLLTQSKEKEETENAKRECESKKQASNNIRTIDFDKNSLSDSRTDIKIDIKEKLEEQLLKLTLALLTEL